MQISLTYRPTIVILLSFNTISARKGYEPDLSASTTLQPSPDFTLHAQNKVCMFIYLITSGSDNVFLKKKKKNAFLVQDSYHHMTSDIQHPIARIEFVSWRQIEVITRILLLDMISSDVRSINSSLLCILYIYLNYCIYIYLLES